MKRSEPEKRNYLFHSRLMDKHYNKINEINKGRDPKKAAKAVQSELERKKKEI